MYELPGKAMAVIQDQHQLLISVLGLKTSVCSDAFFTLEGAVKPMRTRIRLRDVLRGVNAGLNLHQRPERKYIS